MPRICSLQDYPRVALHPPFVVVVVVFGAIERPKRQFEDYENYPINAMLR